MALFCKVLNSVIRGDTNFCCLCFNGYGNVSVGDEITVDLFDNEQKITLTELILSVLGDEVQENLSTFENVCMKCTKSIINIFKFIQTCYNNAHTLSSAITELNSCFERITTPEYPKLFVALNTKNCTSKLYYDSETLINSKSAAVERFNRISKPRITINRKIFKKEIHERYIHKRVFNINASDMILNPNDGVVLKCKKCFKAYPSMGTLRNHFLREHATNQFKCRKCPKIFSSPSLVEVHLNECHSDLICSECGRRFPSKASLHRHELGHSKKLVCPVCGRIYKNTVTYKNHIEYNVCMREFRANPADAQYTCDYCNKKYTQKMSLRVHIQYEHGNYKAHICEWCGKKFWAQSRLKAHIVKHTREKKFSCSLCQGKFVSKESLLYHTRLHTGEKPYKCPECECSFLSASRRSHHIKVYHMGATLQCDICSCKFTTRTYLLKHKRIHKQPEIKEKIVKPQKLQVKKDLIATKAKPNGRSLIKKTALINELPGIQNVFTETHDSFSNIFNEQENTSERIFVKPESGNEYLYKMPDISQFV